MQNLRLHPDLLNQDLHFDKISRWFTCMCKFENPGWRGITQRRHLGAYRSMLPGLSCCLECKLWAFFSFSFLCQFSPPVHPHPLTAWSAAAVSLPSQPSSCSFPRFCILQGGRWELVRWKGFCWLEVLLTVWLWLGYLHSTPARPLPPFLYPPLLSSIDINGRGSSKWGGFSSILWCWRACANDEHFSVKS